MLQLHDSHKKAVTKQSPARRGPDATGLFKNGGMQGAKKVQGRRVLCVREGLNFLKQRSRLPYFNSLLKNRGQRPIQLQRPDAHKEKKAVYYLGFEHKFPSSSNCWTASDDQLIALLFSKIINRSFQPGEDTDQGVDDAVNNLFDLCLYINKDVHHC